MAKTKRFGTLFLNGDVDITDPCYNKDVWCRTKVTVQPGAYQCRTWEEDGTVIVIGLYLYGVPAAEKMEEIGFIGVDSGMAGFFVEKPDYTDAEWAAFCDSVQNGTAWLRKQAFFCCSGDGDGVYPVFAKKDVEGRIIALEIRF